MTHPLPGGDEPTRLGSPRLHLGQSPDMDETCAGDLAAPPAESEATRVSATVSDFHGVPAPPPGEPTAESDTGPLSIGRPFGPRYHIVAVIGVGGMGAVYKAWDEELGVVVALKVIRPEVAADPDAARSLERRFKQELLLARQVTHRNVVRIHDMGEVNGIKYITMPFIEGEDLAGILKREGQLPVPRAMTLVRSLVSGLVAAHEAGIVHRDLKPANIMVTAEDEALIMDFGVARSAGIEAASMSVSPDPSAGAASAHTVVGSIVGTVEYMAPEQARGEVVDQRADIYAVGLILYDMLLGRRRVARAESVMADLTARMRSAPPALRQMNPAMPEPLERMVSRCVQPDPASRFQTTNDLAAEIDALDDNGRFKPIERTLTRTMVASAAAALALIVALTWWLAPGRAPATAPAPMSLLVADFDNRTGEAVFNGALEQALRISLEGATFINAFSRPKARQIASEHIKPGSALSEGVARLVARREMIAIVLAGTIQRDGAGYVLTLRALNGAADPGRDVPVATATADARSRDEVLGAVTRAAADIRKRLGDTADESVRMEAADVFTANSMESLKTYAQAQELQASGQKPEALAAFQRAVTQDPQFALAYSGAAVMAWETGRTGEAHEFWRKMLTLMDRMTERERYRALGTYYLGEAANYEKAIENYSAMVQRYPADRYARSNLALAYFYTLNMPRALQEGRRASELDPTNILIRSNYALYAMYAGDFDTAVQESRAVIQQGPKAYVVAKQAYLPLAIASIAAGDAAGARNAYEQMARVGPAGASLSAIGLSDLASYQGRYADAESLLRNAIASEQQRKGTSDLADKYIALAEAYAVHGWKEASVRAAADALRVGEGRLDVQVPAAMVLAGAGRKKEAGALAATLMQRLQPQMRAYGRIVQGTIALSERRLADAVDAFTAATRLSDVWLARYSLGIAYVQAEHYAEGLAELDTARKRQGEATAVFLNEVPTFRYLAHLPYWRGRAEEGVGNGKGARQNYESYIKLRAGAAPADPLVADARARLARLATAE